MTADGNGLANQEASLENTGQPALLMETTRKRRWRVENYFLPLLLPNEPVRKSKAMQLSLRHAQCWRLASVSTVRAEKVCGSWSHRSQCRKCASRSPSKPITASSPQTALYNDTRIRPQSQDGLCLRAIGAGGEEPNLHKLCLPSPWAITHRQSASKICTHQVTCGQA